MNKNVRCIFLSLVLFIVTGMFLITSPFFDPVVGAFDDFFASKQKIALPVMLDIPIDDIVLPHEQVFRLELRRRYKVSLALVVEDGVYIEDKNTSITGNVQIFSRKSEHAIFDVSIPRNYTLEAIPDGLFSFSFRDIGKLNTRAILVVSDLKINKSENLATGLTKNVITFPSSNLDELKDLRLRITVSPEVVLMH